MQPYRGMSGQASRAFDLSLHSPGQHQSPHPPIGAERPERILERRGLVMFDEKMPGPGAAVAENQAQQNEPQITGGESRRQTNDSQRTADEMQGAASRCRMFARVIRPKLLKAVDAICLLHPRPPKIFWNPDFGFERGGFYSH